MGNSTMYVHWITQISVGHQSILDDGCETITVSFHGRDGDCFDVVAFSGTSGEEPIEVVDNLNRD